MTSLLIKLLNLSISAGMLVLLVFVFRLFLKRYSRRATCLLWIVVVLRLIIPFSFESSLSIMPSGDFIKASETTTDEVTSVDIAATDMNVNSSDASVNDKHIVDTLESMIADSNIESDLNSKTAINPVNPIEGGNKEKKPEDSRIENNSHFVSSETTVNTTENTHVIDQTAGNIADDVLAIAKTDTANRNAITWLDFINVRTWEILAYIWLLGAVLVFAYMVIGYARMRSLTAESILYNETELKNVYICDMIDTAFIMGVLRPRIYLPGNLTGQQVVNILAHERVHLRRKDYIWKFIGFILLTVYWFNPLMWLAYTFLCKDIEFACDEQVISAMNSAQIREYSNTLLVCSTNRHFVYGCPLAFGEVAVKDRIKAALSYKKPLLWVIIVAFVLLVGAAVFFFAKPLENTDNDNIDDNGDSTVLTENPTGTETEPEEYAEEYEGMDGHKYYKLKDGTYKSDMYEGYTYKYKFEVTGQIAGLDQKQVLLSNYDFDTFDKYWAENSSRDLRASFPPEDVLCVEKIWLEDSEDIEKKEAIRLAVENHTDIDSTTALMNAISRKYKNKIVHDFDFTYVMPNGVNFGRNFGYSAGLYFKEYILTWTDFETIVQDESLTAPWKNDKQSENGYFVISTSDEYEDSNCGFKLFFKDGYVHLFEFDEKTETYLWSASLKDGFKPNLYSIRRIFFNKDMYDVYVQYCPYEEEITEQGLYAVNRGYTLDLDGDGSKERIFIANCNWCGYPEPGNADEWTPLGVHKERSDPSTAYNKGLIYINGILYIDKENQFPDIDDDSPVFAVTDIDNSDGKYELLLKRSRKDIFYVWEGGSLKTFCRFDGNLIYIDTDSGNRTTEYATLARFNGDRTFIAPGSITLTEFNFPAYSLNVKYLVDNDGNISRLDGIYDVPYFDKDDFLSDYPEESTYVLNHLESAYLKLTLDLDLSIDLNPTSERIHLEPGYYIFDKTDGKSWIHLVSLDKEKAGWLNLADLRSYVCDYESSGLEETINSKKGNILFSNLINDPAN